MTELARQNPEPSLTPENRGLLIEKIIETSLEPHTQIDVATDPEKLQLVEDAVDLILQLQLAARGHHPQIHEDTDVIWQKPGPGNFSTGHFKQPDQDDRYMNYPWYRKGDRHRTRVAAAIVRHVTALRLGKHTSEITQEDIKENGPIVVYTGTPWQAAQLLDTHLINQTKGTPYDMVPISNLYPLGEFKESDGSIHPNVNSVDCVRSFELPEGIDPRRIVMVAHAPQLARVLHILGAFPEKIPQGAILQAFPLPLPPSGEFASAVMETRGILAGAFKYHKATSTPYPFQL